MDTVYPPEIINELNKHDHIVTRFPPEPNGFLHVGHVKAMTIDFGLANYANSLDGKSGECILRFDDTNPGNDYDKYIEHIKSNVTWMDFSPSKITYTSDYFDELYELGVKLLKNGNGYICELSGNEISQHRKDKIDSPHKTRSIEDNLRLFEEMKNGKYPEGKYTMRMNGNLKNPNPCMWDTVFFRVMNKSHPRTGDKWCLYPSYDFSHCIVDSLEGVTHSLCSKEFEVRRESYYWLLDVLDLRKPLVYEFARLNIDGYNLSKRYIKELVDTNVVESWEDPSLLTLSALKKRGFTSSSLKRFCEITGITKADSSISIDKLYNLICNELDTSVERRVAITDPLEVVIEKFDVLTDFEIRSTFYNHPTYMGKIMKGDIDGVDEKYLTTRNIDLTETIYINRNDFREVDDKKYYGFAPGKIARLRYNDFFKCTKYDKDGDKIIKIYLERAIPEKPKKVKGVLLWVNNLSIPLKLNIRGVCEDPYEVIVLNARGEENIINLSNRIQFEKLGYFMRNYDDKKNQF